MQPFTPSYLQSSSSRSIFIWFFEIPFKSYLSFFRDKESEEETGSVENPASVCGSPAKTKSAESKDPSAEEDSVDGAAVAPRVKLAADGSIILDEERYSYFVFNYGTVQKRCKPNPPNFILCSTQQLGDSCPAVI